MCEAEKYRDHPPVTKGGAAVFSFTPKKRITSEGLEMARSCNAAGFAFLMLTVQKHDTFEKVWVLSAIQLPFGKARFSPILE